MTPEVPDPGGHSRGLPRRAGTPHPSWHRALPGGQHRKKPQRGRSGLPGEGHSRPSGHSGCVGSRIPGQSWAPGPSAKRRWGVLSVTLWLRLGIQTTVQGPAGQGWHLVCPPDPTLPLQTRPPLPSHLPPLTTGSPPQRQHCKTKRGAPSLENCQLPPPPRPQGQRNSPLSSWSPGPTC